MKHIVLACLTILISVSALFASTNKDVSALDTDPRVKTGKLANGLTYYIVKNKGVKGVADFAVAQKVGTVLENEDQKGMCKMLELLATRGTRSFPDSTITMYLNSLGVKHSDIVFYTGADKIQYTIKNLPINNNSTLDSALLILYNWMSSINIDEEDIQEATPMLKNTIMDEWDAQKRIDDKIVKAVFPRSPYAKSITLDQINNFKGYTSKDLRNFYYNWFRPDLQAVFIVGDIDVDKVETQVKSIFQTIPKPLKSQKRNYYDPKLPGKTKVVISKDPEFNKTAVSISFLNKPLLEKYRATSVPYIESYFDDAIISLLANRIQSEILSQNLPIANVQIQRGKFMDMQNMEKFSISFETQPNYVYSAILLLSGEINRLAQVGFNNQEFAKSREIYYRTLEYLYDNRFSQPNSVYMNLFANNFYEKYSLGSIELHFEIMKEILFSLKTKQLNEYVAALLGDKDNVIISCSMPQVSGTEELSQERILSSFNNALSMATYSYSQPEFVRWPKFESANDALLHSADVRTDWITGAETIRLKNGITILFKKTSSSLDSVSFKAISKGGFSLMKGINQSRYVKGYINDIANLGGYANMPQSTWNKLCVYNNLDLKSVITNYSESLEGYSNVGSLDKLFHLINLAFSARRMDENAFNIYKRTKRYEAIYHNLSPANVFADSVQYYNRSNKRYAPSISPNLIEDLDYQYVCNQINNRFANPADFIFAFAGNVDVELIKEYAIKYLAPLKTNQDDSEEWLIVPDYRFKGDLDKNFLHKMVLPRTYIDYTSSYNTSYSVESIILASMYEKYMRSEYAEGEIKELAPRNSVKCDIEFYPEEIFVCNTTFETDSVGASKIMELIKGIESKLINRDVDIARFELIKNNMLQQFSQAEKGNQFWMDVLRDKILLSKDIASVYKETLQGMTIDKFVEFVANVSAKGNHISVVMEGTTEDVNTQNLFRENEFIKDFFGL